MTFLVACAVIAIVALVFTVTAIEDQLKQINRTLAEIRRQQ